MMVPAWIWQVSAAGLIAVVVAEIVLTGRSGRGSFTVRSAVSWVAVYVSLAVIFGLAVGLTASWVTAGQFYAGYLTEYSLSLDNLFIFYVIISRFAVPADRQHRVLLLGIGLALVLRSFLIVAGAAALNRFGWLFYPLGGILVWTAIGLITGRQDSQPKPHTRLMSWLQRHLLPAGEDHGHRPIAWRSGRLMVTPMLLVVMAIGLADVLFAVDSIPAVFGITTNAYLVLACNVFALMGLRQLYVLLARVLNRIVYLNTGLGIICAFIGIKLVLHALHGSGVGWAPEIPAWLSVTVVAAVLLITVTAGILRGEPATRPASGNPASRTATDDAAAGRRIPLTAGERAVLERRFAVIDIDGNGVWQREDYQQLTRRLCEAFGHAVDSAAGQAVATGQRTLFEALLSHMDADGDQEITQDEFAAALGRDIKDRPGFDTAVRTAARTLLQVADQDGNGALDAGEYTRLAAVYGARADEAERAFGQLDQDSNGVLDTAELTLAISQFFTSRDPGARGNVAFGHL
jgi:tellurite resistance protein TerC